MSAPVDVTKNTFKAEVVEASTPVLVDFGLSGALRAGSCRRRWMRLRLSWMAR